ARRCCSHSCRVTNPKLSVKNGKPSKGRDLEAASASRRVRCLGQQGLEMPALVLEFLASLQHVQRQVARLEQQLQVVFHLLQAQPVQNPGQVLAEIRPGLRIMEL